MKWHVQTQKQKEINKQNEKQNVTKQIGMEQTQLQQKDGKDPHWMISLGRYFQSVGHRNRKISATK